MADRSWVDRRIKHEVVAELRRHSRLLETGGPLFGYEADGELVIAHAGELTRGRRRPWAFEPDHDEVDDAIAAIHQTSDGHLQYIGSWHTHPGGRAQPSRTDHEAAGGISAQQDVDLPQPLLLIVATHRAPWRALIAELGYWRWSAAQGRLKRLRPRATRLAWRDDLLGP